MVSIHYRDRISQHDNYFSLGIESMDVFCSYLGIQITWSAFSAYLSLSFYKKAEVFIKSFFNLAQIRVKITNLFLSRNKNIRVSIQVFTQSGCSTFRCPNQEKRRLFHLDFFTPNTRRSKGLGIETPRIIQTMVACITHRSHRSSELDLLSIFTCDYNDATGVDLNN